MKVVKHEVSAWTVGQLRKALADFPDDMAIRVAPLEEPGGGGGGKDYVTLECDYPSGDYPPAD